MYFARIVLRNAAGLERADYSVIVEEKSDIDQDSMRIWMKDFLDEVVPEKGGIHLGDVISFEEVNLSSYPALAKQTGMTINEHRMDRVVVLAKDPDGLWHRAYWSMFGNYPDDIFWSEHGWEDAEDALFNRKKRGRRLDQRYIISR